jgi:NADH-quinone oxidoreductase subunit H
MSSLTTIMFLGGWLPPFDIFVLNIIPGPFWFALKACFFIALFVWARAAYPRYRYDQLMRLGWKIFLPLSLGWVLFTAGTLVGFNWLPII